MRIFGKWKRLFLLALIVSIINSSNVYAVESQENTLVDASITTVQTAEGKLATVSYVNKALSFLAQPLTGHDTQSLIVRDLFEYYCEQTNGKYFQKQENGEFSTILAGTILITEDEWAFIQKNLDEPLTEAVVDIFAERIANADGIVADCGNTTTYEQFYTIVENFMPEYKDWVLDNQAAIKFWIKESLKQQDSVQYYFGDILHETLHEASAQKSGTFQSRRTTQNSWQVWRSDSHLWKLLNPQSNEWITLSVSDLPRTFTVLDDDFFANLGLKDSLIYSTYAHSSSTVNKFNLIGIMDELQSVIVSMRADAILNSIGYYADDVRTISPQIIRSYCWFRGLALCYVSKLQRYDESKYQQFIKDPLLPDLLRDMITYGDNCALCFGKPIALKKSQAFYSFARLANLP